MKYRDLVFALMIVAVVAIWWSGPQSASEDPTSPPRPVTKKSPADPATQTPAPSKLPLVRLTPQPQMLLSTPGLPRATLSASALPAEKLDDLVVSVQLVATEPYDVQIDQDGKPLIILTGQLDDQFWTFRSIQNGNRGQSVTDLSWEVRLADLEQPERLEHLRAIFSEHEIQWTVTVEEAADKANVMTRRILIMPPVGGFITKP